MHLWLYLGEFGSRRRVSYMATLYKFLREGLKSDYGKAQWIIGVWQEVSGPLVMCEREFHASVSLAKQGYESTGGYA